MFQVHFSNRFEVLQDLLLEHLADRPLGVFDRPTLIVPSSAVQRALTLAIAARHGVCAQIEFSYLAPWLWRQAAQLDPQVADRSPFAPDVLVWRIHDILARPDPLAAAHRRLGSYLQGADALAVFQLAQRVAAVFDQYITYRPDWLQAWQAGGSVALPGADPLLRADERWQAAVWRALLAGLAGPGLGDDAAPPAAAGPAATHPLQTLQRGAATLAAAGALPPALQVFALPTMPPLHLQMLQALAPHVEVHLYVLNPCREYWLELTDRRRLAHLRRRGHDQGHEEGHRLLAAWGRQTQAHIDSLVDASGELLHDDDHFAPAAGSTLLAQVQNSLLDLVDIAPGTLRVAACDRSLELHVAHSLTRELEILQDRLLGLFAEADVAAPARRSPPLQPGQVLVVLPDLNAAAPLIDAVFGTAGADRHIPYSISGRAASRSDAPARAVLDLLALLDSRAPVSAVMGLLQQPIVARRFGLDADALDQLHAWVREAGIHWGLDGEHRTRWDLPATPRHSVADGLARLFLGYATPQAAQAPFQGLLPAGDAEGSDAASLGAFWRFCVALQALQRAASAPRRARDWLPLLRAAVDDFLRPADDEIDAQHALHGALTTLLQTIACAGDARPLPLAVLRHALAEQLDDPARGAVAGGAVTFSALGALRNLPFEVVCVLGLNDGQVPSAQRPAEFDLMAHAPRRGDRQRRHDDRNVFLDLLLAARRCLHLSHTGRSVRDNAPLPPSVLVAELLDLLVPAIADDPASAGALAAARDRLVIEHPLQPFALEAFAVDGDVRQRSFNAELAQAVRARLQPAAPAGAAGGVSIPRAAGGVSIPGVPGGVSIKSAAGGVTITSAAGGGPTASLSGGVPSAGAPMDSAVWVDDDDNDDVGAPTAADDTLPPFFAGPLPAPGPEWRLVRIAQLGDFLRHPARFLLRRRLGMALDPRVDELDDDEPFTADRAASRALADRLLPSLLPSLLTGLPSAPVPDRATLAGLAQAGTDWPAGALGAQALDVTLTRLARFAARVRQATAGPLLAMPPTTLAFDLDGEAWQLQLGDGPLHAGGGHGMRACGLVRWRFDKPRADDLLQAWLQHLALCAAAPPGVALRTQWLGALQTCSFRAVDAPLPLLADLLALYRAGLAGPVHFFPRAAWARVQHPGRASAAASAWRPNPQQPYNEGADPAWRLVLRGVEQPLDAEFEARADAVFGPLKAHLDEQPA